MKIYLVVTEVNGRSQYVYFSSIKKADKFFSEHEGSMIIPINMTAKKVAILLNNIQGE